MNLKSLKRLFSPIKIVFICFLPGGSSFIIEKSKSPYILIASVLGIGVAVMTKICGGYLFLYHNFALWATPNLCCSSIITIPRFLNKTLSSIKLCVPTIMFMSPLNNFS